ncbi:Hypothetical protein NTJ_05411 [Nesidiocoris tenuis]|uniref:Uncharacterized protein n=1 Tax=Nesidiocoris tenuis TaxID=355587 RepID=A0ABN7AK20_9HEMI|nr:Hypothetical protein NTJ_05411 [Nesidiocoris tenuis]
MLRVVKEGVESNAGLRMFAWGQTEGEWLPERGKTGVGRRGNIPYPSHLLLDRADVFNNASRKGNPTAAVAA